MSDWHIRRLAAELTDTKRRLHALETAPQVGRSSIEQGGAIVEMGPDGTVQSVTGRQHDGTHGSQILNGPVPLPPTMPVVEAGLGSFTVTWDGLLSADGVAVPQPLDLASVEIFAARDRAPEPIDLMGAITSPAGGSKSLVVGPGEWWVCLRSRSVPGRVSALTSPPVVVVVGSIADDINAAIDEYAEGIAEDMAELDDRLAEARTTLDALAGTTIPALQGELATLTEVALPALEAAIDAAEDGQADLAAALGTLTGETIPALEADLAGLEGTILPALRGEVAALEAAQADLAGRTGTLETVTVPALVDDIATLTGATLPALEAALSDAQADITAAAGVAAAAAGVASSAAADAATAKGAADAAAAAALGAQSTANAASQLAATADGRITVASANPTTGDAAGKPIGAIWEVRSGSTVLRRYVLTGTTTWTQVRAGQDFIGANAIGSAQIIDAAVGTAQIANAAVTDAKIGSLSVGKLVAGSTNVNTLVAQKIAVAVATILELNADRITAGKINTARLDAETVAAAVASFLTLNASQITAGTIDTARLNATAVAAAVASVINLNASRITAGTIATARLNASEIAAAVASIIELNASRITAGTIATARLNASEIAAAVATIISLNASRITSGTIDVARLNAVNVAAHVGQFIEADVSKLVAGTGAIGEAVIEKLWAEVITARKITTEQMIIASAGNMIPWNPAAGVEPHVVYGSGSGIARVNDSYYGHCIRIDRGGSGAEGVWASAMQLRSEGRSRTGEEGAFDVEPGASYRVRVGFGLRGAAGTTSPPLARVAMFFQDGGKGHISSSATPSVHLSISPSGQAWYAEAIFTAPANAATARLYVQKNFWDGAFTPMLVNASMVPAVDASLVVDGSILARHIDVASLTAATAFIESLTSNEAFVGLMRAKGVRIEREDGTVTVNLTGEGAQAVSVAGPDGQIAASIDDSGAIAGRAVSASDSILYRGAELADLVGGAGRGVAVIGGWEGYGNITITGEAGLFETSFTAEAGRIYRISAWVMGNISANGQIQAALKYTSSTSGTPAVPRVTSSTLKTVGQSSLQNKWDTILCLVPAVQFSPVNDQNIRLLLCAGSDTGTFTARDGQVVVEDIGPWVPNSEMVSVRNDGGATTNPAPAKKQYTGTWPATGFRSFRNGGSAVGTGSMAGTYAMQGRAPSGQAYSYGLQLSEVYFDSANIRSALAGATVNRVRVLIPNEWFGSGTGNARLFRHNNATAGSAASGHEALLTVAMGRRESRWVDVGTGFGNMLKNNTAKGVAFNPAGSYAAADYAYFRPGEVKIEIVYTK